MNKCILIGNICNDLELRYTNNNKEVCEFTIAINQQERTDFITCVVFGKQASNLCNYQKKGNKIALEGSLKIDKYQDKDGNNKYKTYVLVSNIEYLGTKKEENAQNNQNIVQNSDPFVDEYSKFGEQVSLDDNFLD